MNVLEYPPHEFPRTTRCLTSKVDADPRRQIESLVAAAFAVPVREVRSSRRCSALSAFARQSAMYLAHIVFGANYTKVGLLFGRDRTTVAHACRRVEDRREDPEIDRVLAHLEHAVAQLPSCQRRKAGR